ncbi:MAG: hypothetical protein FWG94_04570 [Oscillospiraceae bacterium]|nr:hypothetical protein [Oscillospiraceae bacterium]
MLELKPCVNMKMITKACKKCGKLPDASFYLYLATDKEEELASCLFEVSGDSVTALLYECLDDADYWLFDGLLRSGFNYAFEQGITTGRIPETFRVQNHRLFSKLNYPITPAFDITNFFSKYKNCK